MNFVLCKMSCVMRVLMLVFSDGIDHCHCNANTLIDLNVPSVPSAVPSVYSWAITKCNFWNEWLSPGSPVQKGFSPPHSRCPLTLFCQGTEETKLHLFSPGAGRASCVWWGCCFVSHTAGRWFQTPQCQGVMDGLEMDNACNSRAHGVAGEVGCTHFGL